MAKKELLELQMDELQAKYQLLRLEFSQADNPVVQGTLRFDADYQGKEARGEYDIEIRIPDDYPRCVPSVRETGGRVPKDFHRYTNSDLCLGAPVAVRKTFLESPTLLAFVENLVIPHLFSHAYFAEHGEMPFGDLEHGSLGIFDFYKDLFGTDIPSTLLLLKTLADGRSGTRAICRALAAVPKAWANAMDRNSKGSGMSCRRRIMRKSISRS